MKLTHPRAGFTRTLCGVVVALAVLAAVGTAVADLVGYWPLDGDGSAVVGTDGTLVNGPAATTDRNGTAGGALAFNGGSSQYVSIPGGGGLDGATTATVSMWVQWNGAQDNGHGNRHGAVLGRQNNGVFSDNVLCIYNTSSPNTSNINWETTLNQGMNSGVQPGDATWRHIVVAVGPGGEAFHVDGTGVEERTASAGFHSDPSIPLAIGAWIGDGASYSTSRIDDVAVWDRMVSPYQVAALADQLVGPAALAEPLPIAGVTASTELGAPFNRPAANAGDGLGHITTIPNGNPGEVSGMWLSASGDPTGQITFDLGSPMSVGSMVLYNYNEFLAGRPDLLRRGVQDATVLVSSDNVNWTSLGVHSFAQAPGDHTLAGAEVPLGNVEARYVKLDVLTNHGDGDYTGLNEVEFFAERIRPAAAIPPIEVVSARATSELLGGFRRYAGNTVDGLGKYSVIPDSFPSDPHGMWLTHGTFRTPNDPLAAAEIAFDLGGVHQFDSLTLYNYNENQTVLLTSRGINQAEILVSEDNVTYTSLGTFSFAEAPGDGTNPGQVTSLGGVSARYVKLDVVSNHGDASQFAGLNAIEFAGAPLERMPLSGVSVAPSSELFEGGFDRRAVHLVDGTGQFAGTHLGTYSGHTEAVHWLSTGIGFGAPGDDGDPELVFDLGTNYASLESARIWNYNESGVFTRRGVQEMEILVSEDGTAYNSLGTFVLPQAPGVDNVDFSQVLDLNTGGARFVKFDVLSNHQPAGVTYPTGDGSLDNALVGLSEVRFYGGQVPAIEAVSARATSELLSNFRRYASNVVDGAGSATTTPDGWPSDADGMWLTHGTYRAPNDPLAAAEIAFDLGGVHQLDSLVVYNYNEGSGLTSRGVQEAEILISSDNLSYTSLGTFTFDRAPGTGADPGQMVSLGDVEARYLKLDIISNHGDASQFAGLNEVKFNGTPLERMPIPGVSVTASSELFEGNFDRRAVHLVDGTGLFADGHNSSYSNQAEGMHWLSTGVGFGGPGDDDNPELVFDLGTPYILLESARIWNYNEVGNFTGRGVDEMEILVSADGIDFKSLGIFSLDEAPGVDGVDYSQTLDLDAHLVQFVKFDILSSHNGEVFPGGDYAANLGFVGLSEVRFYGELVPEPSTFALAGLGLLALIGYWWKKGARHQIW